MAKQLPKINVTVANKPSLENIKNLAEYLTKIA
ncbi:hypothetical protein BMEGG_03107 [Priestia megaterium]